MKWARRDAFWTFSPTFYGLAEEVYYFFPKTFLAYILAKPRIEQLFSVVFGQAIEAHGPHKWCFIFSYT